MSQLLHSHLAAIPRARPRSDNPRVRRASLLCAYDQDVYERQRTPNSAPPVRSPPPPPPPPPSSKAEGGSRRNLLAALFAVVGVSAGYQFSRGGQQDVRPGGTSGGQRRRWVYADASGTFDFKQAQEQGRRPILRVAGDTVEVLRPSSDKFMRMHVSRRDPHQMIMEGELGEFYTLKPATDKVDVRKISTLLTYFSDPRWELGMRRSPISYEGM